MICWESDKLGEFGEGKDEKRVRGALWGEKIYKKKKKRTEGGKSGKRELT